MEDDTYELAHDTLARHIFEHRPEEDKTLLKIAQLLIEREAAFAATSTYLSPEEINYVKPNLKELDRRQLVSEAGCEYYRKSERVARRRKRRNIFVVAATILGLSLLTAYAFYESTLAQKNAQLAKENAALAEEHRNEAQGNFALAEQRAKEALDEKRNADTQRKLAVEAQADAQRQAAIAIAAKKQAEAALIRAKESETSAVLSRDQAEAARIEADSSAAFAERKEKEAVRAQRRAEGESYRALKATAKAALQDNPTLAFKLGKAIYEDREIALGHSYSAALLNSFYTSFFDWDSKWYAYPFYQNLSAGFPDDFTLTRYSPDGKYLANLTRGTVGASIKNLETGESIQFIDENRSKIHSADFSPDGELIAFASADGNVFLFDFLNTDPSALKTLILYGHGDEVTDVQFSKDGKWLVSCGKDRTIIVWEVASGTIHRVLDFPRNRPKYESVCFSADAQTIAATSFGNEVLTFHPFSKKKKAEEFTSPIHPVDVLEVPLAAFDRDALLICLSDGTVKLAGKERLPIKTNLPKTSSGAFTKFRFSQANSGIAAAMGNSILLSAPIKSDRKLKGFVSPVTLTGHSERINDLDFSPDGKQLLSASDDGSIKIWDLFGKPIEKIPPGGSISFPLFDSKHSHEWLDSVTLKVQQSGQSEFQTFDISKMNAASFFLKMSLSFSGSKLAVASQGKALATNGGTISNDVLVWVGNAMFTLSGHTARVQDINFSPDGYYLVTSSYDGTARLWTRTGELLHIFRTGGNLTGAWFTADGQRLVLQQENGQGNTFVFPIAPELLLESAQKMGIGELSELEKSRFGF